MDQVFAELKNLFFEFSLGRFNYKQWEGEMSGFGFEGNFEQMKGIGKIQLIWLEYNV